MVKSRLFHCIRCSLAYTILSVLLFSASFVQAGEIIILQTADFPQFRDSIESFTQQLKTKYSIRTVCLEGSLNRGREEIQLIKANKPDLLWAIGDMAAYLAREVSSDIPVIFSHVLDWQKFTLQQSKMTGVAMEVDPGIIFARLKLLLNNVQSVGIVFNTRSDTTILNNALNAAELLNLQVITKAVTGKNDIEKAWRELHEQNIDALWMLPDPAVADPYVFNYLREESLRAKVALIGFSEAYVRAGALFSVSPHYTTIGQQCSVLVKRILEDKINPADIPVQAPIGTYTVLNTHILKRLGFSPPLASTRDIDKLYQGK